MEARFHPGAAAELDELPVQERLAIEHAIEKLQVLGPHLPFLHSSRVRGTSTLFELRPRGGRSRWRVLYRQVSTTMVIGAVGPEAKSNARGFAKAVELAQQRLSEL